MILPSILSLSKQLIRQALHPGDAAVDATVGNGHDTLFLAETVGASGRVFGFDIQAEALQAARRRLEAANLEGRVTLFAESHHRMADCLPAEVHGRIKAVMFNLGYLPHGDHAIITRPETTVPALDAAARLLAPGGMMSAVLYTGHPGGPEESEAVIRWAKKLSPHRFQTMWVQLPNRNHAPSLLAVEKRREAP
jgi:SAM-dependent methyltransferase